MDNTETRVLQITPEAHSKLMDTAQKEQIDLKSAFLRIAVVPGGCSGLTYDLGWDTTQLDADVSFAVDQIHFVVDPRSAAYLEGTTLHFTSGLEGKGFHFDNPQAVRNCACGESFGL